MLFPCLMPAPPEKVQPPKNLDTHLAARLALNASASRFAQPSMESKYASWGTASESYSNTRSHHNARRFSVKLEIKLAGSPNLQDNGELSPQTLRPVPPHSYWTRWDHCCFGCVTGDALMNEVNASLQGAWFQEGVARYRYLPPNHACFWHPQIWPCIGIWCTSHIRHSTANYSG